MPIERDAKYFRAITDKSRQLSNYDLELIAQILNQIELVSATGGDCMLINRMEQKMVDHFRNKGFIVNEVLDESEQFKQLMTGQQKFKHKISW